MLFSADRLHVLNSRSLLLNIFLLLNQRWTLSRTSGMSISSTSSSRKNANPRDAADRASKALLERDKEGIKAVMSAREVEKVLDKSEGGEKREINVSKKGEIAKANGSK